ncbi:hypothetical protein OG889_31820 [Streptomyces sp. NBC_00481]|uniref:hypothetical protein n=1 Tax=unclassified Streptomyces TaxID=2593676 RepID=UPI002DDB18E7|nr:MULTISPECIES: hypothetical protein [unclassified Streptomyces]WRY98874.1 hypothetical protein OG889_31820 [Streptomyces sp. NBC_00481]
MTDDVTRGEGIRERGPRETRDADARRDGVKGGGLPQGTRATDTAGTAGATGTRAAVVPGHDTTAGRTGTGGRAEGPNGGRTPGVGDGPGPVAREGHAQAPTGGSGSSGSPLLPHDESDKLTLRLQHAVGEFVDGPRSAVEEADHVLEEAAARFTDAVTRRRRTLRDSWQTTADGRADTTDTEQLRLALRDYRELTERLLRL